MARRRGTRPNGTATQEQDRMRRRHKSKTERGGDTRRVREEKRGNLERENPQLRLNSGNRLLRVLLTVGAHSRFLFTHHAVPLSQRSCPPITTPYSPRRYPPHSTCCCPLHYTSLHSNCYTTQSKQWSHNQSLDAKALSQQGHGRSLEKPKSGKAQDNP